MNLISLLYCRVSQGYLGGTLHGERGELRHNHIHALQAGSAQFENLLFDYCLESQVRGEETRSERGGQEATARKQRKDRQILNKREKEEKKGVGSVSDFKSQKSQTNRVMDKPQSFHIHFC